MGAVRFCAKCGFRPVAEPGSLASSGLYCSKCSPQSRRRRFTFIAIAILCAGIGFAAGRYTTIREPLYIIGTPIQLNANRIAPPTQSQSFISSVGGSQQTRSESASTTATAICGARTRLGKTCQRKVKGGGFCWQHRNNHANEQTWVGSR
jgi:hypothetical protein